MTEHTIADTVEIPYRVTIVCSCGKEYWHSRRAGAEVRHATHVQIELARQALAGHAGGG